MRVLVEVGYPNADYANSDIRTRVLYQTTPMRGDQGLKLPKQGRGQAVRLAWSNCGLFQQPHLPAGLSDRVAPSWKKLSRALSSGREMQGVNSASLSSSKFCLRQPAGPCFDRIEAAIPLSGADRIDN
jgi:hypothetical protein